MAANLHMTQALKAVRQEALRDGALGDRLALWAPRFKWVGRRGRAGCGLGAGCERDGRRRGSSGSVGGFLGCLWSSVTVWNTCGLTAWGSGSLNT